MAWALTQSGFSSSLAAFMTGLPGGTATFLAVTIVAFVQEQRSERRNLNERLLSGSASSTVNGRDGREPDLRPSERRKSASTHFCPSPVPQRSAK
jgi:hypothetical protein